MCAMLPERRAAYLCPRAHLGANDGSEQNHANVDQPVYTTNEHDYLDKVHNEPRTNNSYLELFHSANCT